MSFERNIRDAQQRFLSLLILILPAIAFQACAQQSYDEYLESLYSETVSLIQPRELNAVLEGKKEVYLLDTRSKEEFEVSHIRNARWVGYDDFRKAELKSIPKDAYVVLYCTVGYRSEKIGEKLQEMGYSNVHNVYGSILKWKNEGYPVVNQKGEATEKVHTYSQKYAKWLENGQAVLE